MYTDKDYTERHSPLAMSASDHSACHAQPSHTSPADLRHRIGSLGSSTSTDEDDLGRSGNIRSTKGASKQRRDMINNEILNLRDLLPLPEAARQRLSQLQIMSLCSVYIRKCNYFNKMFQCSNSSETVADPTFEFPQSLSGFVLVATREGKLLYISENVTEYLGHSMVDMMTQGDNLYDIIDKRDHATVQANLLAPGYGEQLPEGVEEAGERTFFCRMSVARSFRRQAGFGEHKMMHVQGHFIQPSVRDHYGNQPVFMAVCSPLITPEAKETISQNNTMTFQTVHGLDMKIIEVAPNGEHHLGYTEAEMFGRSWYEMLHPSDIHEAKEKHVQLIKSSHEMGCMLTVRLQTKAGSWIWVNMVMHIRQPFVCDNGDPAIVCINHVIRDSEAELFKLQSQLYSSHIAPSPEFMGPPQGASPSHTITQVPVERDRYTVTGTYITLPQSSQGQEERGFAYGGDSQEVPTTSDDISTVVGGSGDHLTQLRGSIGSSSDSSPDQSHQGDRSILGKQSMHANVLSRLKRKVSDPNSQCRPSKRPRSTNPGPDAGLGGGTGGLSYRASILATGPGLLDDFVNSVYSGGDVQLVGAIRDAPVYSQLAHIKKEIELHPLAESPELHEAHHPLSPLTPQSLSSDGVFQETQVPGDSQLMIDVGTAVVPLSILTPDPSPANSPAHSITSSPGYQSTASPPYQTAFDTNLPTELFAQLEEHSLYQNEREQKKVKAQPKPVLALAKQENLPHLDWNALEDFFSTVEETKREAQRQVPSTVRELEGIQSPVPCPPSSTGGEVCLSQLNEDQLNRLVASVTDTLLDMVSNDDANMSVNQPQATNQMPTHAPPKEGDMMDLSSILADDTIILSPSNGDQLLSSHEELCVELHQLNELASSGPSYGSEELTVGLFTETL